MARFKLQRIRELIKFTQQCPKNMRGKPLSIESAQELAKTGNVCGKVTKKGNLVYYKTGNPPKKEDKEAKQADVQEAIEKQEDPYEKELEGKGPGGFKPSFPSDKERETLGMGKNFTYGNIKRLFSMGGLFKPEDIRIKRRGNNVDVRGENSLAEIDLTYDLANKVVHNHLLMIEKAGETKDLLPQIFLQNVLFNKDAGFKKIRTKADIDVGGYAWAKYGFEASPSKRKEFASAINQILSQAGIMEQKDMPQILSMAQIANSSIDLRPLGMSQIERLEKVFKTFEAFSWRLHGKNTSNLTFNKFIRDGKFEVGKFVLLGSSWNGEFDLSDDSVSMRIGREYLKSRMGKTNEIQKK